MIVMFFLKNTHGNAAIFMPSSLSILNNTMLQTFAAFLDPYKHQRSFITLHFLSFLENMFRQLRVYRSILDQFGNAF